MKNNRLIIFGIILACVSIRTITWAKIYNRQFYEAEKARNNGLFFIEDSSASSDEFLRMKDSGSITWNIAVNNSSWYELSFRYRSFKNDKEEYIIRNGYQYAIGFGTSENWNIQKTYTFLHKGKNEIILKASWGNIDIDYLSIKSVNIEPSVKPSQNIFYKESPQDIFFKINRYGHRIQSVTCKNNCLKYEISEFQYYEDAVMLRIPKEDIIKLDTGSNKLQINYDNNCCNEVTVNIKDKIKSSDLTIITPYIDHGASVLIILPTNKIMLIDCGQEWARDTIIIPLLHRMGIDTIHYFIITHYHPDHDSGDKGKKIKDMFHTGVYWDYRSFRSGADYDLEGANLKILNSYEDGYGEDENPHSLSFMIEYKGFKYVHGGDTYHTNQETIKGNYPNYVEADVFHANHHFHGSVDTSYLRMMNPVIVLIQSQEAIYARSAYMDIFKNKCEKYLIENKKRYIEDLPTFEVGTVIIRVNSNIDWTYETNRTSAKNIPTVWK